MWCVNETTVVRSGRPSVAGKIVSGMVCTHQFLAALFVTKGARISSRALFATRQQPGRPGIPTDERTSGRKEGAMMQRICQEKQCHLWCMLLSWACSVPSRLTSSERYVRIETFEYCKTPSWLQNIPPAPPPSLELSFEGFLPRGRES